MAEFLSSRLKTLKVGIDGYTDNTQVGDIVGNVEVKGAVNAQSLKVNSSEVWHAGNKPTLADLNPPTSSVSLNNQKITNLGTPTSDTDAVTKAYVDAFSLGLDVKASVRVATTAGITLSGIQTIDDVEVVAGNRVLVKNQSTGSENGIYVAAAGPWTRATDFDTDSKVTAGAFTFVEEGTIARDSGWVLTTNNPISLGVTSLLFTQFSGGGQIIAGAGLTKTDSTLDVGAGTGIAVNPDSVALTGQALALHNLATNGFFVRTGAATIAARSIAVSGSGISITDGNGVAADPTISLSASLSSVGGLTPSADRLPYYTGTSTADLATLTSFGRSLIDDVDAIAARTTLGLGTIATQDASSITATGDISLQNQSATRYYESTSNGSNYISIKAPSTITDNVVLVLPSNDGNPDQVLGTDGNGNLSWVDRVSGSGTSGDFLVASTSSEQSGYFGNIYLKDDSNTSHYLEITNSADLTALRTLSVNVNDASRSVSLSGNLSFANNFTTSGDFAVTLTATGTTSLTLPTSGTLARNDQSFHIGTTSVAINRASGAQTLTGVSIDGSASTLTTTRTLWGQNFNGEANVSGSLSSVGDITATAGLGLIATGANSVTISTNGSERLRVSGTGQVEAGALGLASAPVLTFSGDQNTGIYSPGADQLSVSTAGTQKLTVDSLDGNAIIDNNFPTVRPTLDLAFALTKRLDQRITFTRASTGTYVGADGLIKTAAVNEARFDHNPTTGESLGLLVEEQRTNLLPWSEEFDNASWVVQATAPTINANSAVSPSGSNTADLITFAAADSRIQNDSSVSVVAGTSYTFSLYVRAVGTSLNKIRLAFFDGAQQNTPDFTVSSSSWTRIAATFVAANTTAFGRAQIRNATNLLANSLYIWGAQLEAGAFPTSYIPTTTSAATRNADVASITGTNFSSWYRQDEGTVFAHGRIAANGVITVIDDGSFNNRKPQVNLGSGGNADVAYIASGSVVASFTQVSSAANTNRWATAYATDNYGFSSNGLNPDQDSSGALPSGNSAMRIGSFHDGSSAANGTIRRLTYWPIRLPNSTLQSLTA